MSWNHQSIIIRSATLADYDGMRVLLAEVDELHRFSLPWMFQKPAVEARPREFFEQLLDDQDCAVLVAEANHQLVGMATALLRASPTFALFITQRWGVLDNIAVSNGWRRRGIGTALIRDAERWAKLQGANWLELGVYEFNQEARAFYTSLGYLPVSTKLRKPFDREPEG